MKMLSRTWFADAVRSALVLLVAALVVAPVVLFGVLSVAYDYRFPRLLPAAWSVRAWAYIFGASAEISGALATSFLIAAVVAALAVVVALPAARALAMHDFPLRGALLLLLLLPLFTTPLAATMGMHKLFLRYGLTDSLAGVVLVHLVPAVPYATLLLVSQLRRFDTDWEAQARTLGADTFRTWRDVTLPMIAPGVALAWLFAFLVSWSQYLPTLLIGGGRVRTLPLLLVAFSRGGDEALTAALSLVFLLPTVVIFVFVARFLRSETA